MGRSDRTGPPETVHSTISAATHRRHDLTAVATPAMLLQEEREEGQ